MVITRKWSVSTAPKNPICLSCNAVIRVDNGDSFLQCALCERFLHRAVPCSDITTAQHDFLNRQGASVRFYCDTCEKHVDDDLRSVQSLKEKFNEVTKKQDDMLAIVIELKNKMDAMPAGNAGAASAVAPASHARAMGGQSAGGTDIMIKVVAELGDQERRKQNIIIAGLLESASSDPQVRKNSDLSEVHEIIKHIAPGLEYDVKTLYRLGKVITASTAGAEIDTPKPRLIKVVLGSSKQQGDIVSKAKVLRNLDDDHKFYSVYVNADRTPAQRAIDKQIRDKRPKKHLPMGESGNRRTIGMRNGQGNRSVTPATTTGNHAGDGEVSA